MMIEANGLLECENWHHFGGLSVSLDKVFFRGRLQLVQIMKTLRNEVFHHPKIDGAF